MADVANAVHMTRHDVPAKAVVGTQCFFQVEGAFPVQAAGFVERFGRNVDGELTALRAEGGDGHASAVEGDAVAQAHIVKVPGGGLDGEALAVV